MPHAYPPLPLRVHSTDAETEVTPKSMKVLQRRQALGMPPVYPMKTLAIWMSLHLWWSTVQRTLICSNKAHFQELLLYVPVEMQLKSRVVDE